MRLIAEFRLAETSISHLYGGDGFWSGSLRSKCTTVLPRHWNDLSVWQKVKSFEDGELNIVVLAHALDHLEDRSFVRSARDPAVRKRALSRRGVAATGPISNAFRDSTDRIAQ